MERTSRNSEHNREAMPESNTLTQAPSVTPLDRWTGPLMFWAGLVWLTLIAGLLCTHGITESTITRIKAAQQAIVAGRQTAASGEVDPPSEDLHDSTGESALRAENGKRLASFAVILNLLGFLFLIEWLAHALVTHRWRLKRLVYCLAPPLRMGGRDHLTGDAIWIPRLGWTRVDRDLFHRIESTFSVPMLLVALMVLPLLGLEYYQSAQNVHPSWYMLIFMKISESVIWMAFTLEFIILVSVAPKKLRYCKQHWLDIAIIFLPLIGFLRILRVGRVLRLQRVAKIGRVYRMRGVTSRMFRGVLVLDIVRQIIEGNAERKLASLKEQLLEQEEEALRLRDEIRSLEQYLEVGPEPEVESPKLEAES